MKKEVFESGHINRERGARRPASEGSDSEVGSLSTFMHATAKDKFLPMLAAGCRTMNAQVTDRSCCGCTSDIASFVPSIVTSKRYLAPLVSSPLVHCGPGKSIEQCTYVYDVVSVRPFYSR